MSKIILPEETANRIINHPWAGRLLPQFYGEWFRNQKTGEIEFRAEVSDETLADFVEGVRRLSSDD